MAEEVEVEGKKRGPRSNQKLKIMYLMKILLENTDETHSIRENDCSFDDAFILAKTGKKTGRLANR